MFHTLKKAVFGSLVGLGWQIEVILHLSIIEHDIWNNRIMIYKL